MNSKKLFTGILGMAMTTNLLLPIASFAQETPAANRFCSRIDQIFSPIDQRIADREAILQAKRQERSDNLTERRSEREERRSENRTLRDTNR